MWAKSKYLLLTFLLLALISFETKAQILFSGWSNNYMDISSYLGLQTADRFNTFSFSVTGKQTKKSNWKMTVQLMAPIVPVTGGNNVSGLPFPPDKIGFIWTSDSNNPNFNLNGIGASRNLIKLTPSGEVILINHAKQAISTNGALSASYQLFSAVKVDQGKYLDGFVSPNPTTYIRYRISLLFTLYDASGASIGTLPIAYDMQIRPKLTDGDLVDNEPDYSIQILPAASDATLQFINADDYKNGVSLQMNDAIQINSITDYEIRVKSMDPQITSSTGANLPLSIISLKLLPGPGVITSGGYPLHSLATVEKTLGAGLSQDKKVLRKFHLYYGVKLDQTQLENIKTGTYEVSILYLLIPK